jgi:hypothetical protein
VTEGRSLTARQTQFASWSIYLLVDIVVLNLFVEFAHSVVIDSFYISILTAILLRLLLEVTLRLEHRVSRFFETRTFKASRLVAAVLMYLILFASKFVILEVIDRVFGDHVDLGGFVEIVVIVVTLIVAESAFRTVFNLLGRAAIRVDTTGGTRLDSP